MKKVSLLSICIFFAIFIVISTIISLSIGSTAIRLDEWNKVKDEEGIRSAFVFQLNIHSWFETEHLEDNEFLFGDIIDYCQFRIKIRKPMDLAIAPTKIVFISPSKQIYEKNLSGKEDFYSAGQFTYSIEEALVHLNESGLWSVNLIFNDSYPYPLIYSGDSEFTNSSEIHIFRGLNINIYTNLEYQQLRAAKALEESAKAMEGSTRSSIISAIFLSIAAIAAVFTILFYWWKHKEEQKEKKIDKWVECKTKFDDVLLDLLILLTEVKTWLISFNKLDKLSSHHYTNYQIFDNKIKILHKKCLQNLLYISKYPIETGNFIKKTKKITNKTELIIDIWNKLQTPFTNDDSKKKIDKIIINIEEILDDINNFLNYK